MNPTAHIIIRNTLTLSSLALALGAAIVAGVRAAAAELAALGFRLTDLAAVVVVAVIAIVVVVVESHMSGAPV